MKNKLKLVMTNYGYYGYLVCFKESAGEMLPPKIDAVRKELLRVTHKTENSMVISFFFPVGNPFMINSSFNVYFFNR